MLPPPPPAKVTTVNAPVSDCGGCQVQWVESNTNRITGTFVVPNTTGTGMLAIWVGVEGGGALVQTGIVMWSDGGEGFFQEWKSYSPTYTYDSSGFFTPQPGDTIKTSIVPRLDGSWSMRLCDLTLNDCIWDNGDLSSFGGPSDTVIKIPHPSVAWVVEDPNYGRQPLLDYGNVSFSNAWPAFHVKGAGIEYPGGCETTTTPINIQFLEANCE